jgi:hypothetical protein
MENLNGKYYDFKFLNRESNVWKTRDGIYSMKKEISDIWSVRPQCLFFGKPLFMYSKRKDLNEYILVQFIIDANQYELHEIANSFIEKLNENKDLKNTLSKERNLIVEISAKRNHEEIGIEYKKEERYFDVKYNHSDKVK